MVKDKKAIKRDILAMFRSLKADETNMLPPEWLESDYFLTLDFEEKKLYKKAVNELVSLGLVESVKGSHFELKLTSKGFDLID